MSRVHIWQRPAVVRTPVRFYNIVRKPYCYSVPKTFKIFSSRNNIYIQLPRKLLRVIGACIVILHAVHVYYMYIRAPEYNRRTRVFYVSRTTGYAENRLLYFYLFLKGGGWVRMASDVTYGVHVWYYSLLLFLYGCFHLCVCVRNDQQCVCTHARARHTDNGTDGTRREDLIK